MKLLLYSFLLLLLPTNEKVRSVDLAQLKSAVQRENDTLYVVNFWATWCAPCVKELPYFEEANKTFTPQKVKVVLVSVDGPKELLRVNKFIQERGISADTYLLDAGNPNNWINQIESEWSGSIPATIMYKNGKKLTFFEHDVTQTTLDSLIQKHIQ